MGSKTNGFVLATEESVSEALHMRVILSTNERKRTGE